MKEKKRESRSYRLRLIYSKYIMRRTVYSNKNLKTYDGNYIQNESERLTLKNYLEKNRKHFMNVIEEINSTKNVKR